MIPNNFTRRFGGVLPNPLFFKPPDGTEWKVYWIENDGKIWFQKGWKDFATYYSLDYGHLVVFEYQESSHFEVHIFDMSALEVEYPFHNQISNVESDENLNEESPLKKKRMKAPMLSRHLHKTEVNASPNLKNLLQNAQSKDGKSTQCTSLLISPHPRTNGNLVEAKKFVSENPFVTINITPSYLDGNHPSLSSVFARRYFKKRMQNVMIKFGNKFWHLKVFCYLSKGSASFGNGWTLFAKENKLEVGDVCVFELINIEDKVFDLHIFRGHNYAIP
ncbi:hypothetical protein TanjilG_07155 [Lupinus angustifolius]|uniref:TF-B3 domain-containing protein n=2 Tax=Lupinus angustifolius TaxID=3871 RepID=A0A1J7GN52_LUPAN|nr:hypothetical protein TanjilG_07155 [Lupinus angustifolius]